MKAIITLDVTAWDNIENIPLMKNTINATLYASDFISLLNDSVHAKLRNIEVR